MPPFEFFREHFIYPSHAYRLKWQEQVDKIRKGCVKLYLHNQVMLLIRGNHHL
jgi:hypothetical protein